MAKLLLGYFYTDNCNAAQRAKPAQSSPATGAGSSQQTIHPVQSQKMLLNIAHTMSEMLQGLQNM